MTDPRLAALIIYLIMVAAILRWFWKASPRRDALHDPQDDLPQRSERLFVEKVSVITPEEAERAYGGDLIHSGEK